MFEGDSRVSVRRILLQQDEADRALRDLGALFLSFFECPSPAQVSSGRAQFTSVGFASLLFGIASALILIGSVAFVIGVMMMPLVAMVAMFFSFVGILDSFRFNPWYLLSRRKTIICPK